MINIYIDESGSLTQETKYKREHFFKIGLVITNNKDRLRIRHKRYVSKQMKHILESHNESKYKDMFDENNKFIELKGSSLPLEFKTNYLRHIYTDGEVDFFIIKVFNDELNNRFFDNTARSFNYLIKIALQKLSGMKRLRHEDICLQIDNQNVRTDTRHLLEDYLITELVLGDQIFNSITVEYFESHNNAIVQTADILANLYFGTITEDGKHRKVIDDFIEEEKIICEFIYPPNSK